MKKATIAFYNTENFFDTETGLLRTDNEYLPGGGLRWTIKKYHNKLSKISFVISRIGKHETDHPPLIVGLAEIESKKVLYDLVNSEHLREFNYDFVHYDSPDERGIDNALLYRKDFVKLIHSEPIRHTFERESGGLNYTRDTLFVNLELNKTILHIFVEHLPSRRENNVNRDFRNSIMLNLRKRIDELLTQNPLTAVVLMGDLNGNPQDEDARRILRTTGDLKFENMELYNPMLGFEKNRGTIKHENQWYLFDQMLFTKFFFMEESVFDFEFAQIFDEQLVREWDRRHNGAPFRTYAGSKYLGGYSDHFPVYSILNFKQPIVQIENFFETNRLK